MKWKLGSKAKQNMRTLQLHIKVHQNDEYFHSTGKINRKNITDIATQIQFVSFIFHGVYVRFAREDRRNNDEYNIHIFVQIVLFFLESLLKHGNVQKRTH